MDENDRMQQEDNRIPPLSALPVWLESYAVLRPKDGDPWSESINYWVSLLLPVLAEGFSGQERDQLEGLLCARLMLDLTGVPFNETTRLLMEAWLASTVLRFGGWSVQMRRAWWHVEAMAITAEVLQRQTLKLSTQADAEEASQLAGRWLVFADALKRLDREVAGLFALSISEGLLECAGVLGCGTALSLNRYALQTDKIND